MLLKSQNNHENNDAEPKSSHFRTDLKSKKNLDLIKKINETEDSSNDIINIESYKPHLENTKDENSN